MATERQKEIARAQSLGVRQIRLINALLSGPTKINYSHWGVSYGPSEVSGDSWRNLRRRLSRQGFKFRLSFRDQTVTMVIPEEMK